MGAAWWETDARRWDEAIDRALEDDAEHGRWIVQERINVRRETFPVCEADRIVERDIRAAVSAATADGREGPAFAWLKRNSKARLWVSPVTLAEVLEGAEDFEMVRTYLGRYAWQGIHRMHAESVAVRQSRSSRRMGENDAWQCAVAERMNAVLVAHAARDAAGAHVIHDRHGPALGAGVGRIVGQLSLSESAPGVLVNRAAL